MQNCCGSLLSCASLPALWLTGGYLVLSNSYMGAPHHPYTTVKPTSTHCPLYHSYAAWITIWLRTDRRWQVPFANHVIILHNSTFAISKHCHVYLMPISLRPNLDIQTLPSASPLLPTRARPWASEEASFPFRSDLPLSVLPLSEVPTPLCTGRYPSSYGMIPPPPTSSVSIVIGSKAMPCVYTTSRSEEVMSSPTA